MQCSIFTTGTGEAEEVRSHFRRFMSRGHEGWSDTFDRQFDERAVWFYLQEDSGKHLAAARLIFRQVEGKHGPIPSDLGDLARFMPPDDGAAMSKGGITLSGRGRPICEASGMSFKSRKHLALLLPVYMRWMQERRLGPVYSLYDANNAFVNWLQCQLLMFRHVRDATVAFEEFRYKGGGPVTWQATVQDPLLRIQAVSNALRNNGEAWDGKPPQVQVIDRVPTGALEPVSVPTSDAVPSVS